MVVSLEETFYWVPQETTEFLADHLMTSLLVVTAMTSSRELEVMTASYHGAKTTRATRPLMGVSAWIVSTLMITIKTIHFPHYVVRTNAISRDQGVLP